MGGLYGLDQEILEFGGYPKNSLICVDDVGLFRPLINKNTSNDVNDRTQWKLLLDFKPCPKYQRVISEYFYSSCNDKTFMYNNGAVLCDGTHYVDFKKYDEILSTFGSCPYIGWDDYQYIRSPIFDGEHFINPGNITNIIFLYIFDSFDISLDQCSSISDKFDGNSRFSIDFESNDLLSNF